jgi:hypothetical protein
MLGSLQMMLRYHQLDLLLQVTTPSSDHLIKRHLVERSVDIIQQQVHHRLLGRPRLLRTMTSPTSHLRVPQPCLVGGGDKSKTFGGSVKCFQPRRPHIVGSPKRV